MSLAVLPVTVLFASPLLGFFLLYLNKFTLNTDIKFLMEWKSHYSLCHHHDMFRSLSLSSLHHSTARWRSTSFVIEDFGTLCEKKSPREGKGVVENLRLLGSFRGSSLEDRRDE